MFEIKTQCSYCWGTGKNPAFVPDGGLQDDCPKCEGTGKVVVEELQDIQTAFSDAMDKLNDILNKCNDILEAVQEP